MALINCPECKKEVSDSATTCPSCGYGVRDHIEREQKAKKTRKRLENSNKLENLIKTKQKCKIAFIVMLLISIVISIGLYYHFDAVHTKAKERSEQLEQNLSDDEYMDRLRDTLGAKDYLVTTTSYYKELTNQRILARKMEVMRDQWRFLIAAVILIIGETIIFIIFKKNNLAIEKKQKENEKIEDVTYLNS